MFDRQEIPRMKNSNHNWNEGDNDKTIQQSHQYSVSHPRAHTATVCVLPALENLGASLELWGINLKCLLASFPNITLPMLLYFVLCREEIPLSILGWLLLFQTMICCARFVIMFLVDNLLTCSSWKKALATMLKIRKVIFSRWQTVSSHRCEHIPRVPTDTCNMSLTVSLQKNDGTRQSKSHTTISATIGTWRGTVLDNPWLHHDMSNCSNYTEGNYLVSAMDYGHLKKDNHLANHR